VTAVGVPYVAEKIPRQLPVFTAAADLRNPTSLIEPFRVMTWNILASVHTHWNSDAHGGASRTCETVDQRHNRHIQIVAAIHRLQPDVVLLQEVDTLFLPLAWKHGQRLPCGSYLHGYTVHQSYSPLKTGVSIPQEGVAILTRNGVWETDPSLKKTCLEKTRDRGWKCSLVLHARRCHDHSQRACFVSVHLQWGAPSAQANLLRDALKAADSTVPIVLGGDFNITARELKVVHDAHRPSVDAQLAARGLRRMPSHPGQSTGLTGEMGLRPSNAIDHLYCSRSLKPAIKWCSVGPLAPPGQGPWTSKGANDGSDHEWVLSTLFAGY